MALLEPSLCVLDETDSGLDIDALRLVADGVNQLRSPERGMLVITHYQRLLEYIVPDFVHVLSAGKVVRSGGKELALELEARGLCRIRGGRCVSGATAMNAPQRPMRTEAEQALLDAWENARAGLPGGSLVAARRAAAIALFSDRGLPHRRVEERKYTDLAPGCAKPIRRRTAGRRGSGTGGIGARRSADGVEPVSTGDGRWLFLRRPFRSRPAAGSRIEVAPLAELLAADGDMAAGLLATSEVADGDVAVALNTAFATDGVVVFVPKAPRSASRSNSCTSPVKAHRAHPRPAAGSWSARALRCGSSRAIADRPARATQVNTLADIDIARGALVSWSRLQTESDAAQHLTSFVARMADDNQLDHLSVSRGAALARWAGFVRIEGSHARAGFYGATMLSDKEHGDNTLIVRHVAPDSVSNELFKNVGRRPGDRRLPGDDRGREAGPEDRRQDDDPGVAPLGRGAVRLEA